MSKKKPYTFIDLFAGLGGFHIALESLGCKCVFTSELKEDLQRLYEINFPDTPRIEGDITKVDLSSIPHHDILCAGFPCQPFSYAGEKKGFEDTTRGTLFFDICRILKHHKPAMLFLENVKGLVSHKEGSTLKTIEDNLRKLGYYPHWKVLSSLDYGLPQKRERWYCVAFRNDLKIGFESSFTLRFFSFNQQKTVVNLHIQAMVFAHKTRAV